MFFHSDRLPVHDFRCCDVDNFRAKNEMRNPGRAMVSCRITSHLEEGGNAGQQPQHWSEQFVYGHAFHQVSPFDLDIAAP